MIKAVFAFKKAVASIRLGNFIIFRFFFEALGLSDVQAKGFGKSLNDSQDITDSTDKSVAKSISEVTATNDSVSFSSNSRVSDTIGSSDSGSLRSQGYCAFDYFSEDYVGASRTF